MPEPKSHGRRGPCKGDDCGICRGKRIRSQRMKGHLYRPRPEEIEAAIIAKLDAEERAWKKLRAEFERTAGFGAWPY